MIPVPAEAVRNIKTAAEGHSLKTGDERKRQDRTPKAKAVTDISGGRNK